MISFPTHEEFHLKVQYGVNQHILGFKRVLVRGDIAGHFVSIVSRPLILDFCRLAHVILNPVGHPDSSNSIHLGYQSNVGSSITASNSAMVA